MQFIDLQSQYQLLKTGIDTRIHNVLDHGQYIMGPEVYELEEKLSDYVGVKNVISCANGTDALRMSLLALGIGSGDAVIVPTFTFFASAEAISSVGAEVVFVDVDVKSFNLCPDKTEEAIKHYIATGGGRLKGVMVVDLFGLPANYSDLQAICDKYDLMLIEDGAQGFGGSIDGRKVCSFGRVATTSFFPAKPLSCFGDGGAIFTDDDQLAEILRSIRVHGKGQDKYDNVRIGLNSRLDTIQAAILLEKLKVFDKELESRTNVANVYNERLTINASLPITPTKYISSWASYTIIVGNRDLLVEELNRREIPSMVYYKKCMHQQTAYSHLAINEGSFPVAEKLTKQVLSLPIGPYIRDEDLNRIIEVLNNHN